MSPAAKQPISKRERPAPPPLANPPRTIAEWAALYTHVLIAGDADNASLAELSRSAAMRSGALSISYARAPDYFAAAKESGIAPVCLKLRNPDGSLGGATSIIMRDALIEGQRARYGYFCDLRTLPTMARSTWLELTRCYAESVRYVPGIDEVGAPRVFLTTVIDKNERALRLLRTRLPGLVYQPLAPYEVVQSFFRFRPTIEPRLDGIRIRRATPSDAAALRRFLAADAAQRPLADYIADKDDELSRRLANWADFDWTSFFLAETESDGIVGCVAPRTCSARRPVLSGLTATQRALSLLLPLFGGRSIRDGEPLDLLYLTHFATSPALGASISARVRRALLMRAHAERQQRHTHAVAWLEWPRFAGTRVDTRGFACVRTAGTLYQVLLREHVGDAAIDLSTRPLAQPPSLDISTL